MSGPTKIPEIARESFLRAVLTAYGRDCYQAGLDVGIRELEALLDNPSREGAESSLAVLRELRETPWTKGPAS